MSLCEPCRDLAERWMCRKMPPAPIRIISIGDSNPRLVEMARRARADDFYQQNRDQVAGVYRNCEAGRHAKPREPT